MHIDELLGAFWRDGLGLADAAERAGLRAPVAACPGWDVADLVWHTGEVHHFWTEVVSGRWVEPSAYEEPDRPADDGLVDWYRTGVGRTLEVLRATDPPTSVWSWAPRGGDVGWVVRRMAQETAVHRWDAEAAAGTGWRIDADVAADGIDEFLEHFTDRPVEGAELLGGSVHLHCTDPSLPDGVGEWLVTEPDAGGRLDVVREHTKGDAAVRGAANDLLLALWRRIDLDDPGAFEVFGDRAVAERLLARSDLS